MTSKSSPQQREAKVGAPVRRAPQTELSSIDNALVHTPQQPDNTPPSPELAQQTLQSILQRAQRLTDEHLNNQPPTEVSAAAAQQKAAAHQNAPAFPYIQRKATLLAPPVATLKNQGSKQADDSYNKIVSIIESYLDDARVPEKNFGRRITYVDVLGKWVREWERVNGSVDDPVTSIFFKSKNDKRRPILKALSASLPVEMAQLQMQGLMYSSQAHIKDRETLKHYLNEGAKSDDRMLRNTCEWFQLGKAKLYAVTPTGDAEARIGTAAMNTSEDEAWFPEGMQGSPGDILAPALKYNEKSLTDNTNVNLDKGGKSTGGWNVPGVVVITNPARASKETVWETLRHEVQHDADFNKGRDAGANVHEAGKAFDTTGAGLGVNAARTAYEATGNVGQKATGNAALKTYEAEVSLTRYKTEYRAYSYQEGGTAGKYGNLDNSVADKARDGLMFTERQLAIFNHIYGGYDYVKTNWDANTPLTGGRTFRGEVIAYRNPDTEAFNKYNSARVDDFYRALDAIGVKEAQTKVAEKYGRDVAPVAGGGKVSDLTDPGVVNLLAAIDKLHGDDADYIFNESLAMMKKIKEHLDGAALAAVLDKLKEMADFSKLTSLFD